MAQTYQPTKHGKAPITGKGQMVKAPSATGVGPSNHIPQIGRPQIGEPGGPSSKGT